MPNTETPRGRLFSDAINAGKVAWQRAQSENSNYPLDNLLKALRESMNSIRDNRRGFLRRVVGGAVVGTALAAPTVDAFSEMIWQENVERPSPELKWAKGQKERLDSADSMVICLPPTGVGLGHGNANLLLPELEKIGAVGYIDYATDGLKPDVIAEKILDIKSQHPKIKKFSIYANSSAGLVFGRVIEEMGKQGRVDDLKLEYMFTDCLPVDVLHLKEPAVAALLIALNGEGTATLTGIENSALYGSPFDPQGAPPLLLADQLNIMWRGQEALSWVARKAEKDNTKVVAFRPKDAATDPFVDDDKSEKTQRRIFGKRLVVSYLEGNQGHANPDKNQAAYLKGFSQAIAA